MDTPDDLFADLMPKGIGSFFNSSRASVSSCTSIRSRLSLSYNRPYRPQPPTASAGLQTTAHELKHSASFVEPQAVDKKKYNAKLGLRKKNVFCPKCGLPERLVVNTLAFHVSTCKGKDDMTEECYLGEACSSDLVRHFRTHRHTHQPHRFLSPKPKEKTRRTVPTITCVETTTGIVNVVKSNNSCTTAVENGDNVSELSQETYVQCKDPVLETPPKDKETCNGPSVSNPSKDSWRTCNSSVTTPPKVSCQTCDGQCLTSLSIDSWTTCIDLPATSPPKVVWQSLNEPSVEVLSGEPNTIDTQRAIPWEGSLSDEFEESPSLLDFYPSDSNNIPLTCLNNKPAEQSNILPSCNDTGRLESRNLNADESSDDIDIHSVSTVRRCVRSPLKPADSSSQRLSGRTAPNCRVSEPNRDVGKTAVRSSTVPCHCEVADEDGVCANVTVRVSPAETAFADTPTPVAVKVNATCCESGWESIGIDADTALSVRDVNISLCECSKKIVLDCKVLPDRRNVGGDSERRTKTFQPKFHSTMEELGISRGTNGKRQVQLSITSFLKGSKKAKTIRRKSTDDDEVECLSVTSSDVSSRDVERESIVEKQRRNKLEWQQLMKVNKSRDFTYVSAGSSSEGSHSGNNSDRIAPTVGARKCPFYKRIPETDFVVDAFSYGNIPGVNAYFLSHFHYDHYIGLRRAFSQTIYCTRITASLVRLKIGVNGQFLNELQLDEPTMINGVRVTALEANHCPGSAMFLFQLPSGKTFLHVGDFRADPIMESYPAFWNLSIDKLFLDTTYCNPRYTFPSQLETIAEVVRCAETQLAMHPKTLFVCGSYTIGKEKVFVGVAEAIDAKLWAATPKRQILKLLEDPVITSRLVTDPLDARVHVCEMKYLRHEHLQAQLDRYRFKFTHILAFKPSGWEYSNGLKFKHVCRGNVTVIGVPYSEHSSFTELRRFVQFVKPSQVIPTVNVGRPETRKEMAKHFDQWLRESGRDIRQYFPHRP